MLFRSDQSASMRSRRRMLACPRVPRVSFHLPANGWNTCQRRRYPQNGERQCRHHKRCGAGTWRQYAPGGASQVYPRTAQLSVAERASSSIDRTENPKRAAVQQVQIRHRRAHVRMPQQFLHRPSVAPIFGRCVAKDTASPLTCCWAVSTSDSATNISAMPTSKRPQSIRTS